MARNLVIFALLILLQACGAPKPYAFSPSDFVSVKELPYDSPPQVIYRLDDHRFVTLERYRDCYHGETFYNDTKANIRHKIGIGRFEDFQGRIINADPTGMNIALPLARPPHIGCGDRGCNVHMFYSTDGGVTFQLLTYMEHRFKPFRDSRDYTIYVTKDRLYVAKKRADDDAYVEEYPMLPGIDLSKPFPPGIRGSSFAASKRPGLLSKLRTPSGQDRVTCDASLKPTNPDAPLDR